MESLLIPAGILATAGVLFHTTYAAFSRKDFGRNRAVGLRTRATLASDEAWREGHRTAAPLVLAAALTAYASAAVCAAVAVATNGDVGEVLVGVVPGIGFLSVFVLLVSAGRTADKAARSAAYTTD